MTIQLDWSSDVADEEIPQQWIAKLEQLLSSAAAMANMTTGTVSLSFVDDLEIRQLNKQYRGVDQPTDVLSFALDDDHESENPEKLLGDIVISVPTAKEQSEAYGHSLEREIGFLFVHGFLHLIGYDHQDDAAEDEMFTLQETILQQVGLNR